MTRKEKQRTEIWKHDHEAKKEKPTIETKYHEYLFI